MIIGDIAQVREGLFSVDNLPVYRCVDELTGADDVKEFGECSVFTALGVTSMPFPPTTGENGGSAEAVVLEGIGNEDGIVVGARDARCAGVYAKLSEGDTVVHSVDPGASAQLQVKANRQVTAFTKDSEGNNAMINLDGKNDVVQIAAFGGIIQMSKNDGITITAPGGSASIMMKDDTIMLVAQNVMLGGIVPAASVASWVAGGAPSVPNATVFKPAPNVWVGASPV
jgi:hypothetical protein